MHRELGSFKVSCRWVPKMLTEDHKAQRLMASRAGLRYFRQHEGTFLSHIVTTDETWVYHYEAIDGVEACDITHQEKFKSQRAVEKVMLTVFWDMKRPVTIGFPPKGSTVNAKNYCELLETVRGNIRSKWRGLLTIGVILLQDNARLHTAARTLAKIDHMG